MSLDSRVERSNSWWAPPRNSIRKGFILHAQSISSIRERDGGLLGTSQTSLERVVLETRLKASQCFGVLTSTWLDLAATLCARLVTTRES